MDNARPEDNLDWVRHELEILRFARTTSSLRPLDAERYRELCEIERKLVRESRAA